MRRYALTSSARNDLLGIFEHIRKDDPHAAQRVMRVMRDTFRKLSRTPGIGHFREDLVDESIRFWPVYSYLIVYRAEVRPIQVLRVLHGARDIQSILEAE